MAQKYIHLNDKVKIADRFYRNNRQACLFIAKELSNWDMSMARWFRLVNVADRKRIPRVKKGAWGTTRYMVSRFDRSIVSPVSINCNVYGDDDDFPNTESKLRRPDGRKAAHRVLDSVDAILVHIAMHELWHFLCATGQLNCENNERNADDFADVMVYKFTGEPVRR